MAKIRIIFIISILFALAICNIVNAKIIHVPADSSTIQKGINGAVDGDTVLVKSNIYYENLVISEKSICLASDFIYTNDATDIMNTVIDGSLGEKTLTIINCENTVSITGYVIQNGPLRGIECNSSEALISNNIITGNGRSGLYIEDCNPEIINNSIIFNKIYGVDCLNSSPVIKNCNIWGNFAAGIVYSNVYSNDDSKPVISYCNIQMNSMGNEEECISADPLFTHPLYNICSESPCINAGDPDITDPDGSRSDVGIYFSEYAECEYGNVYYVSTTGNNESGDGSSENPFKTIQYAIQASITGDTIIVESGVYEENINFYGSSITLASQFVFTQDTSFILNTVIDGGDYNSVVIFANGEDTTSKIIGFTIKNGEGVGAGILCESASPIIENNIIKENMLVGDHSGGGILCNYSSPIIRNNKIINNRFLPYSADFAFGGGGIYCTNSSPLIENNVISGNLTIWPLGFANLHFGGGILCIKCTDVIIRGNVISNNYASYGGGICCWLSEGSLSNNIIYNNIATAKGGGIYIFESLLGINKCTLYGNIADSAGGIYSTGEYEPFTYSKVTESAIWNCSLPEIKGNVGVSYSVVQSNNLSYHNIVGDPLFCDADNGDFHLQSSSPCLPENNEYGVHIGALGAGCGQTDIFDDIEYLPFEFSLQQNIPNPFNPSTEISFSLPRRSLVNLNIYNLLGQKVETLVNKEMEAGSYNINWNGIDAASGIYFYRLESGDFSETKKMLLLK